MSGPRQVFVAVFDGVELLDVTGPAEVFTAASRLLGAGRRGYGVTLVAARTGPVVTAGGVQLVAEARFDEDAGEENAGELDTVVVPGALELAPDGARPVVDPEVVDWIVRVAPRCRRVASVCSGAHMLAAAGLLDGRRATTHWFTAERLAADHPAIDVDPDPIFIRSDRIWTGAGVSSGMDLALAMVAEDHGESVARTVARWLVMYLQRPGGQSQFSVPMSAPVVRHDRIRELQGWITENPGAELSVATLARRAHLSERHFARVFARELGMTPAAYVEASRVEAARRMLERSDDTLPVVAARCGFGSVESLYRTFRRRLGSTPGDYRHRFRLPTAG
ncbi:MAG: GlxA family transcriptional regulator [Actinobacteria bacterium]|nr:GlxA family transcriptional regulator [Actinomycetota bacterium]